MRALSGVVLALITAPVFGQYSYYFTDPMQSLQTSHWATGSTSPQFTNLYGYTAAYGGTMVSTVPVPDGTSSYEIRATLRFPGNTIQGVAQLLLRANTNIGSTGMPSTGYVVTYVCNNSGTVTVQKWVNDTVTQLSQGGFSCSDGMTVRSAISDNGQIISFANDSFINWAQDSTITSGAPGIVLNTSQSMLVSQIQLGPADRINPGPIPSGGLTYSVYSNHIDFQWQAVPDDPNGTGVSLYQFLRDDNFATNTTSLSWSDTTVQPGVEYSYTFVVYDGFFNSVQMPVVITVPPLPGSPPTAPDGHRVGIRSTGAYWGASTEQIDVLSGNLNYTVPLLKPQARTGWGVGFALNYNSQNWRQDWAGLWSLGEDVGYGYGWKLLAGSLTPIWGDQNTLSYYLYTDSTGAEYRLNQNNNGIWTSLESIYVTYDSNANELHFRDGSFWVLGCTSGGSEPDFGTMYPTTMEDTNGNTITITYMAGVGLGGSNSSARISLIQDVRTAPTSTYIFSYSGSPSHLASIVNSVQTGESYTFTYSNSITLQSPFTGATTPYSASLLTQVAFTTLGEQHSFSYTSDNSGTLQNVVLPYGGQLTWSYESVSYGNGATFREISARQLSKDGSTFTNYPFTYGPVGYSTNQSTTIDDPGGVGEKNWAFSQSGVNAGVVTQYQGRQLPGPVTKTQNNFTWTQDNVGNLYIGSTLTTLDPGQSYQAVKRTDQVVDVYGNVLKTLEYDYNSLSAPARVHTYTYLNSSAYTSRYIYNRMTGAGVGIGNQNVVSLINNTYDNAYSPPAPNGIQAWDNSVANITARGNVTSWSTPSDYGSATYDQTGTMLTTGQDGVTTQVTTNSSTNFAAPSALTVGGMTTSIDYSTFLSPTSVTGPNGDTSGVSFDPSARPLNSTSPYGAVTSYTYTNYSPGHQATTGTQTGTRWTSQILDGFGRTVTAYAGDSGGAKSQVDTVYGSCACSPTGKMMQQSLPHVPNGTPAWTTYSYDGIGRTLSVVAPDGASTTTYIYQGNTVKLTDPAGKWKIFTMDAFGHLTTVDEPNPAGSGTLLQPVAPPTFGPTPGSYYGSQSVTLSTSTSGATIRYTTNGSMPSETAGTVYTGPFVISSITTIKAIAYAGGMADSAIATGTYTISGGGSGGPWYSGAWSYRKAITIAHGQVSGSSNLTNFPVLISLTDSNLASSAQSNGNDILFTDSTATNKLNHQIESYTSSNGALVAWVQVSTLSPTSDTVIYMYYGNGSAGNQQNVTGVWNSNYVGVYHFANGTTLSANDSTSNAQNGAITGATATAGKIGGAASFGGTTGSYIDYGAGNAIDTAISSIYGSWTISSWFYASGNADQGSIFGNGDNVDSSRTILIDSGAGVGVSLFDSEETTVCSSGAALSTGWHYVVWTYNDQANTEYLDGSAVCTRTWNFYGSPYSGHNYASVSTVVNGTTLGAPFNGAIDETNVLNVALSSSWILTTYNNQSSPSTFYSLSSQQTQSGGGSSGGLWYNGAWAYRKPITITSSQIAGTLTNFPVLVSESDSNLAAYAQSSGNDILFTASDGITKLNHEIETYSSGNIVSWVQMPTLSTSNNVIYMYYGNSAASRQQNPVGVWDSNFTGVWHFPSGSTLNANDSTGNENNGSNSGATVTSGKIGSGAAFNGTSSYINIGDSASLQVEGLITMSAWANVSTFPPVNTFDNSNTWAYILGKGYDNTDEGYFFRLNAQNSSVVQLNAGADASGNYQVLWPISGWSTNTWHHVVGTYDGTAWRVYMDGILEASTNQTTGAVPSNPGAYIGAQNIAGSMVRFWNGSLDEVRLSNIARSPAWITTEYNNQGSPGSFLSFGAQQNLSGGGYYPPSVTMPTFEPAPGSYSAPVNVVLSTSTPGATIHYTTDGSTPSETAGLVYTGAFLVSSSTTVKAMAFAAGIADSQISSGPYTVTSLASGGDYITYYTYDGWDNVATVTMPRPTGTQTRSFSYYGKLLISATNPENGTVNYYYGNINPYSGAPNNVYNKLAAKVDAKGQVVAYSYDSLARLIEVQKYPSGISGGEDACQQEIYYYDSNPFPGMSGYSQNAIGRLTGIQYYAPATGSYMARGTSCQTKIQEQYSYKPSGLKINKGMLITRTLSWSTGSGNTSGPSTADLESSYTYDTEGRMLSVQYPGSTSGSAGPNLAYYYDTMGRLNQMIDQATSNTLISSATYDPANRLTAIVGTVYSETRTYNVMGQLIALSNNAGGMSYNYSATQNNGKITGQTDVSGEQAVYAYDTLNRLASAAATSNAWGQSYAYDGFGNLTDQTTTAGSPPGMHLVYDAHNHPSDVCADANGNLNSYSCNPNTGTAYEYDVLNRIVSVPGNTNYAYAPGNKRIWRGTTGSGNTLTLDEITFWSVNGQKLATYGLSGDPAQLYSYSGSGPTPSITYTLATSNYYFGHKLIKNGNGYIGSDRLGSVGKFYPWGQEKPSATTNGTEKFTGYFRDSETGLDYAKARYHQPGMGRFLTPDPYLNSAGPDDPGSWNRYAYVVGDPVNLRDPRGLDNCAVALNKSTDNDGIRSGPSADPDGDDGSCGGSVDPGLVDDGGGDGDGEGPSSGDGTQTDPYVFTATGTDVPDPDPGNDTDDGDPDGPEASTTPTFSITLNVNPCVVASGAAGGLVGAGVGALGGFLGGLVAGGAAGTFVLPGYGTAAGAGVGAGAGAWTGALGGGLIGIGAGAYLGSIFCPSQPMMSKGGGQGRKGERNWAAKPSGTGNPGKGVKPDPKRPGEWLQKDPHTGNWFPKPRGWKPGN